MNSVEKYAEIISSNACIAARPFIVDLFVDIEAFAQSLYGKTNVETRYTPNFAGTIKRKIDITKISVSPMLGFDKRYVLAHEVAHGFIDQLLGKKFVEKNLTWKEVELLADVVAGDILIPTEATDYLLEHRSSDRFPHVFLDVFQRTRVSEKVIARTFMRRNPDLRVVAAKFSARVAVADLFDHIEKKYELRWFLDNRQGVESIYQDRKSATRFKKSEVFNVHQSRFSSVNKFAIWLLDTLPKNRIISVPSENYDVRVVFFFAE